MSHGPPPKSTLVENGLSPADLAALRETASWTKKRDRERESATMLGEMVGRYRITRLLGEGGVGAVYLGEHPVIGSRVAIKVLHDEFADSAEMIARFIQEACSANAIESAHIVRFIDFGKLDDGRDYAVMDYLEGRPLDVVLDSEPSVAAGRLVRLMRQIAEAMVAAHAAGIVHRDLKPANIFLERTAKDPEFVRILDFGIAKLLDADEANVKHTKAGGVLGTPVYCAPEQAMGKQVGPACDIYALGAIAYEALTGRPVFEGNVVEILVSKSTRDVPPLDQPGVPAAFEALILQMLAREPESRPASMQEVVDRLEALVTDEPTLAAPPREGRRASKVDLTRSSLPDALGSDEPTLAAPPREGRPASKVNVTRSSLPDAQLSGKPSTTTEVSLAVPAAKATPEPARSSRRRGALLGALAVCGVVLGLLLVVRSSAQPTPNVAVSPPLPALPSAVQEPSASPTTEAPPTVVAPMTVAPSPSASAAPAGAVLSAAPSAPSARPALHRPGVPPPTTGGKPATSKPPPKKSTLVDPFD